MLILALDTTTRRGSLALARDGRVLDIFAGDAGRTHATRLPGDILAFLARHRLALADIDLYGVAAGPGSFTGLRIGVATVQGLAFAHGRRAVGVSALDAVAEAAGAPDEAWAAEGALRAAWMDAHREEVFACLYRWTAGAWLPLGDAVVNRPGELLASWAAVIADSVVEWVGDGAVAYADTIGRTLGERALVRMEDPPLAPAVAALAWRASEAGSAVAPAGIRPIYVRRPDAELVRERLRLQAS